jgi:5-methylcytosine-specific restriction endonuclease McrA
VVVVNARAKNAKRMREWRAHNKEWVAKDNQKRYAQNREAILKQKRDYYQRVVKARDATPEGRLKDLNRKHLRRSLQGGVIISMDQWNAILSAHNHACAYCQRNDRSLEMDHVIALTKGGKHCPTNIVPACKPCNSSKGNR